MKDSDRTWLTLWAWGVVIFGLALATFTQSTPPPNEAGVRGPTNQ
mgnify:CR=1 FL=1